MGAMRPGLHGAQGDAYALGDLLMAEAIEVLKAYDFLLVGRQLADGLTHFPHVVGPLG